MKPVRSLAFAAVVVLAGSRCSSGGPDLPVPNDDFTHSVSTFTCGPADGPATTVLLARDSIDGLQPPNPYVRLVIWRAAGELPGTSWDVGSSFDEALAYYEDGVGSGEPASSGTVRITRVVPQERVEGTVDLRFPAGRVTEAFSAPWIEMFILCG